MGLVLMATMNMHLSNNIIIMNKNSMLTNNATISTDTTSMRKQRRKNINVATIMTIMIMNITKVIVKSFHQFIHMTARVKAIIMRITQGMKS